MGSCDRHCICILCLLNVDSLFSASVNWYRVGWKLESGRVDQCWSRTRFIPTWISTTGRELCSLLLKMPRKGRKRARSSKTIAKEKFPIGELAVGGKYSERNLFQTAKSTRRKVQSWKSWKERQGKVHLLICIMLINNDWFLLICLINGDGVDYILYRCLLFFTEDIKLGTVKINNKSCDPKCASALLNSVSFVFFLKLQIV